MIKLVLFDIDGVLTDGSVYIDNDGRETKKISFDDIDAIFKLKKIGIKIGFITGEKNSFTAYVNNRFQPNYFYEECKGLDKYQAFQNIIKSAKLKKDEVCYVGDTEKDVAILKELNHSYAPADADIYASSAAKHITRAKRGAGVIKEVTHIILQRNDVLKTPQIEINEHLEIIEKIQKDSELITQIETAAKLISQCFKKGGRLLICGNGGSAADSQHLATEMVSKYEFERKAMDAEALTVNTSSLTAIGNDFNFNETFARQVEAKGRQGDVLLAISTSGRSRNVIRALEMARQKRIQTIAFVGEAKTDEIKKILDVCISVPSMITARVQEAHILIGHIICGMVEKTVIKE